MAVKNADVPVIFKALKAPVVILIPVMELKYADVPVVSPVTETFVPVIVLKNAEEPLNNGP